MFGSSLRRAALLGGKRWTPASFILLGLATWWDPSDLSTMWQDDAGTIPAVVGQPVGRMVDKIRGLVVSQSTQAACPILRNSGSLYWLEFDGVDDVLNGVAGAYGVIAPNHYIVLAASKTVQAAVAIVACNVDATNYHRASNVASSSRAQGMARDAVNTRAAISAVNAFPTSGVVKVLDSQLTASALDLGVNAVLVSVGGAAPAGNAQIIIGNVAHAINFYGASTCLGDASAQRSNAQRYFAAKGGISF